MEHTELIEELEASEDLNARKAAGVIKELQEENERLIKKNRILQDENEAVLRNLESALRQIN